MQIPSIFYWGILWSLCKGYSGAELCKHKLLKSLMLAACVRTAISPLSTGQAEAAKAGHERQTSIVKAANSSTPCLGDLHQKGHSDNHTCTICHPESLYHRYLHLLHMQQPNRRISFLTLYTTHKLLHICSQGGQLQHVFLLLKCLHVRHVTHFSQWLFY